MKRNFLDFIRLSYQKLFLINDSPHKIALGVGLGVFAGIFPGTGPLAALFLAFVFRANRASAIIGSLLTNTWFSVVVFLASIKLGSGIIKVNWQEVNRQWLEFLKDFHWQHLFKLSLLKLIIPVIIGYLIIAFLAALAVYLITLVIISRVRKTKR